ncbi:MAG TPA: carboxypeptidase regulatory-like domain-containing protein [Candidatus Angelobacter sp.]
MNMHESSLQGQVLTHDGSPAADVAVRVSGTTGTEQTITNSQGQFQFLTLSTGIQEVEAASGISSARQTIMLNQGSSDITLRLEGASASGNNSGNSISVQQLKVPDKAREKYEKAVGEEEKQHTEKALKKIEEALAAFPCYADALTLKSVMDLGAGRAKPAADEAQRAIHCDASAAKAYFVLGAAFNAQGQHENAIRTLNEGIRFQPNAWQPYYELGKSFLALHRAAEAIPQLNRAAALANNSFPLIHTTLASALLQIKDYIGARAQLLLFLKAAPEGPEADRAKTLVSQLEARLHAN